MRGVYGACLVLALVWQAHAIATSSEPEIRVRLKKNQQEIEITGYDLTVSPPSAFVEAEENPGFHRARITRRLSGAWIVKIEHEKKARKIQSESLWVRGTMIRIGPEPVPYDLEIVPTARHTIDVIARLDLDTYLEGVLPAEMPVSWPLEALKAQAVAARSFVLRESFERRHKDFDVDSNVIDQAYKFIDPGKHRGWAAKLKQAVQETHGEILVDDHDRVMKAFYSADCGCQSEDPKFVWGEISAFQSVKDPTCRLRRPTIWSLNLDRGEVRRRLLAALSLPEDSRIQALHVGGRTPSGRVSQVVAAVDVGGHSQSVALNSQEFRRIFGFQRIQSTDFSLRWEADQLEISGRGSGHGVGLCQRGAKSLADEGSSYRDILKTYYPRARVVSPRPAQPRLTSRF